MSHDVIATTFLLLLLLDPLGNVPVVLSLLRGVAPEKQRWIVTRESLIAGLTLILFVFVGDWLLATLHLTAPALEISGGLILFLIALRMVFPARAQEDSDPEYDRDPLIVPLAIPMMAGPSALATVLLTSRQAGQSWTLLAAIVLAIVMNILVLRQAGRLARLFGKAGLAAMERLMGLALTTIAVQMLISGIRVAFSLPVMP